MPFSPASSKASTPLELIHANLWGPAPISSTIGVKYFLLLLDDFSRYSWIYEVHTKDQVLPIFIQFKALVEKQFNLPIKHLQSDNEGKFKALIAFLAQHGIQQRLSCPYTP